MLHFHPIPGPEGNVQGSSLRFPDRCPGKIASLGFRYTWIHGFRAYSLYSLRFIGRRLFGLFGLKVHLKQRLFADLGSQWDAKDPKRRSHPNTARQNARVRAHAGAGGFWCSWALFFSMPFPQAFHTVSRSISYGSCSGSGLFQRSYGRRWVCALPSV